MNHRFYQDLKIDKLDEIFNLDMSSICDKFSSYLQKGCYILDVGCGTARDSLYFHNDGFKVESIDNSATLVDYAKLKTSLDIKNLDITKLEYINKYDAVFACASLLHFKSKILNKVLDNLYKAMKNDAVIYASFKYAKKNFYDPRFFNNQTKKSIKKLFTNHNFIILEVFITTDILNRSNKWINIIGYKK